MKKLILLISLCLFSSASLAVTYEITSPEGITYEIEGPEGATKEEIVARIQQSLQQEHTAEQYAQWIVDNEALKGTPDFNTVAEAYKFTLAEEQSQRQQDQFAALFTGPSEEELGNL
jgi:ribulose 1,5-bisphosphate carboxylase large subunit-like protein